MITLDDIRECAFALPEVEEKSHFNRPGFRVRDKLIVSVHLEKGDTYAILGVSPSEAKAAAADDPSVYEEVWRNQGEIFVGLRVDLSRVGSERFRTLLEYAWRNKAPKRLIAAYDEGRSHRSSR